MVGGIFGRRTETDRVAVRAAMVNVGAHGAYKVAQAVIFQNMHRKMLFFAVFEQRAAARVVFRPGVDIGIEPERGGLDALSAQLPLHQ